LFIFDLNKNKNIPLALIGNSRQQDEMKSAAE
jgi:hypothetical protein